MSSTTSTWIAYSLKVVWVGTRMARKQAKKSFQRKLLSCSWLVEIADIWWETLKRPYSSGNDFAQNRQVPSWKRYEVLCKWHIFLTNCWFLFGEDDLAAALGYGCTTWSERNLHRFCCKKYCQGIKNWVNDGMKERIVSLITGGWSDATYDVIIICVDIFPHSASI